MGWVSALPSQRCDVQDGARSAAAHVGQAGLDQPQRTVVVRLRYTQRTAVTASDSAPGTCAVTGSNMRSEREIVEEWVGDGGRRVAVVGFVTSNMYRWRSTSVSSIESSGDAMPALLIRTSVKPGATAPQKQHDKHKLVWAR